MSLRSLEAEPARERREEMEMDQREAEAEHANAGYTLGFVQRDGNEHDEHNFGGDLGAAIAALELRRAASNPHHIHWYVYDADDPERGYFTEAE